MAETSSIDVLANEVGNIAKNFVEFKNDNREVITEFKEETRAAHLRIENKVDKVDERIDSLDVVTKEELDHVIADAKSEHDSMRGQMAGLQGQVNSVNTDIKSLNNTVTLNKDSSILSWLNLAKWALIFISTYGALYLIAHFGTPK